MREIKFRAWDKTTAHPHMIDVEAVIYDEKNEISITGAPVDDDFGSFTHLTGSDFVLMQYTGLNDKNDVEIYEKDYLSCGGCVYRLIKHIGGAYELHEDGSDKVFFLFKNHSIVEVVANECENPELLTQVNE